MIRRLSRALLGMVIAFAGVQVTAAWAQAPQQQRVPAPEHDPATGLSFPPQIAGARQAYSIDYGRMGGRPELGYAWNYQTQAALSATIYVYTMGVPSITEGPSGAPVVAQFEHALADIHEGARLSGSYDRLQPVNGPTDCAVAGIVFRCITLSAVNRNKVPVFTTLMVTGYRGRFLKLRLDWPDSPGTGQAAGPRFAQTLVEALRK